MNALPYVDTAPVVVVTLPCGCKYHFSSDDTLAAYLKLWREAGFREVWVGESFVNIVPNTAHAGRCLLCLSREAQAVPA